MKNNTPNLNLSITLKDGRKLGYAEYGDPFGTVILYFHGFPGSRLESAHFHDVAIKNPCLSGCHLMSYFCSSFSVRATP